ncbi:21502_t:CDS:2, partial [Racocetra persica]
IENYEDSENEDNYSLQFNLASIIIGNYKSKKLETVTLSFNSDNDAICFGLDCGRLDIQFMGVESYEREDRKICLKLRNDIVKWILPVQTKITENEITISIDPTCGELLKADRIIMFVADYEKVSALDREFRRIQVKAFHSTSLAFQFQKGDEEIEVIVEYKTIRHFHYIPLEMNFTQFLIILRREFHSQQIHPPLRYVPGSSGAIGIYNEEDWCCYKLEAARRQRMKKEILDVFLDD